jgi:hypothetical protein
MRVLNSHTNVLNDNSTVDVSVYILLLANEEDINTNIFREKDPQTYWCVCVYAEV